MENLDHRSSPEVPKDPGRERPQGTDREVKAYEASTNPTRLNFEQIVGADEWGKHERHLEEIRQLMIVAHTPAASEKRFALRTTHCAHAMTRDWARHPRL